MAEEKKEKKEKGYVYILTNPSFDGWIKIGRSINVKDSRVKILNSATPYNFEVYATLYSSNYIEIEKNILDFFHSFSNIETADSREFFKLNPKIALEVFYLIKNIFNDCEIDYIDKSVGSRNPRMNFNEMELNEGTILYFKNDKEIFCTISAENQVLYNGENKSLSEVTRLVLGLGYNVQPSPFWMVGEKCLYDIYIEKQVNKQ